MKKSERYSAPRRFDLATMLVVTAAYALLFTTMKALDFSVFFWAYVAGFITLVAFAQSLFATWQNPRKIGFFFRNNPRQVSVLAGIVFCVLAVHWEFGATFFWKVIQGSTSPLRLVIAIFRVLVAGTFMGYFSGVLVGGVFLVADYLRRFFRWLHFNRTDDRRTSGESPWDD